MGSRIYSIVNLHCNPVHETAYCPSRDSLWMLSGYTVYIICPMLIHDRGVKRQNAYRLNFNSFSKVSPIQTYPNQPDSPKS